MPPRPSPRKTQVLPPLDYPADEPAKSLIKAGVTLSRGTWGTLGTTVGAILVAAGGWAQSMKTDLTVAITKLDAVTVQMQALERRLEKVENRILDGLDRANITHGDSEGG